MAVCHRIGTRSLVKATACNSRCSSSTAAPAATVAAVTESAKNKLGAENSRTGSSSETEKAAATTTFPVTRWKLDTANEITTCDPDGQWTLSLWNFLLQSPLPTRFHRVKTFEQRNKYSTLKNYKLQRSFPYRKSERGKLLKFREKIFHIQWKIVGI